MADAVKIPIRNLPKYMAELREGFGPALLAGLTSAAARSVSRLVQETDRKGVVNTRRLVNSWSFSPAYSTGKASAVIRVFNDAPYSGVMELGRRAGRKMPWLRAKPVEEQPIYLWCISKLGMTEEDAKKAAWPIAHSIKRKGIKGRRIMADILRELGQLGAREVSSELDRAVRKARRGLPVASARLPRGGS